MAGNSHAETECEVLDEFVDDAGGARARTDNAAPTAALQEFVRQVARQAGVPRFKVDEVVERVLAAAGADVEARLREEVRKVMRDCQFGSLVTRDGGQTDNAGSEPTTLTPA